ncbi:MAG: hypothetical protein K6F96_09580 [Bacteroidales bacterium]|nr:hypothetical protein [Bacteroidales bacterium]
MRKRLLLGAMLALSAVLMLSCNKNRFDYDHLEAVEGSGQWKLPIGSLQTTLGDVLKQFGQNQLISYDENGNLQIAYSFKLKDVIKGTNFLNLGSLSFNPSPISFPNPFPGVVLPVGIDTVYRFQHNLKIDADSATIETAVVKSGTLESLVECNLGHISRIEISSSDITLASGDTLFSTMDMVDLAGATFRLHDEYGNADTTLTLHYAIYYQLYGGEDPDIYTINTVIGLKNLKLQEISGHVDRFQYEFSLDTAFSLPLDGVNGALSLVGTRLKINQKNTFQNLFAKLLLNQAELYGGTIAPSQIFTNYPVEVNVIPSNDYVEIMDETLNINVTTEYDAIRLQGMVDFNPSGVDQLIVIRDTSSLSLGIDAIIPMQFNVPEVTYVDTLDLNLGEINAPSLVKEVVLNVVFKSQIPFDLKAQFYTYNSQTGQITGRLVDQPVDIKGSYDGRVVLSEANLSITNEVLQRLIQADKLIMQFAVDTDGHDVVLNLANSFGLTIKADVIYGGSVDINN